MTVFFALIKNLDKETSIASVICNQFYLTEDWNSGIHYDSFIR